MMIVQPNSPAFSPERPDSAFPNTLDASRMLPVQHAMPHGGMTRDTCVLICAP